jgi:hypothetical protein
MRLAGRVRDRALVLMEALKRLPEVVVETEVTMLARDRLEEDRFLLESVTTREEAVRVAMLTLPAEVIWKRLAVEEEATVKGLIVLVP